jgi:rare lipoprotein A
MSLSKVIGLTSWISYLISSSQGLLKVPDYVSSILPMKVFSIANSPLEKPVPLFFSEQFSRTNWHSELSTDASLQAKGEQAQLPAINMRSPFWQKTAEDNFCRAGALEESPFSATNVSDSSSTMESEAGLKRTSQVGFSQHILQVIQNLMPWRQRLKPTIPATPAPVVVLSSHASEADNSQNSNKRLVKRGFWRYSQRLTGRAATAELPANREWFQVWVGKHLVAQFADKFQADLLAQRLIPLLAEPRFNASKLKPTLVDSMPAGKMGDSLLFVVSDDLATALQRNQEVIAIEWINNLRVAFGAPPLNLVEAQQKMHGLVESQKTLEGLASWYGPYFHGRLTATGETFDQNELTAAHPSLPFNTYLKVTNQENGDTVIVRINDRGPYIPPRKLDLSWAAARCINSEDSGVVPVEAVIMEPLTLQ